MNYTKEQTEYIVEAYLNNPTRATVDNLAAKLERPPKSIIGKLSREGVYRRNFYTTKTGEDPVTKVELVTEIANNLNTSEETLAGLEKAPKNTLKNLVKLTASE
tara:strand:+ start:273 stop:584 length:312 start_codon:yes stop_codon:yes gene_type:complete